MRLTRYTDYALRVLIYLAAKPDSQYSIGEITRAYGGSRNHLMKVVNDLVTAGFLVSVRGRFGGVKLARPACDINVGAVVRHTERSFELIDCTSCVIAPACGVTGALKKALAAFIGTLDTYTLADLSTNRAQLASLLAIKAESVEAKETAT